MLLRKRGLRTDQSLGLLENVAIAWREQFGQLRDWFVPKQDVVQTDAGQTISRQSSANISLTQIEGRVPITLLHLRGALNASNYLDFIAEAKKACESGTHYAIFDMSEVSSVGISSLLALHSVALLLRGEEPLDPANGWATLRAVARELKTRGLQDHFKLLGPQPKVEQTLEQAGFKGFLEIYTDLDTAIASF